MSTQSSSPIRAVAASLLLTLVTLLHALLTPAQSHLVAEDPGCPHLRPAAAVAASLGGARLCPPPAVSATVPDGRTHPEHDPRARACPDTGATRGQCHPPVPAATAADFATPPRSGRPTAVAPPADPGMPPAPLLQILRC
ncbi:MULTISPECIES: hypothetical protein [unclassified Streptomyces]|uniref:hypothetical protein n=1 Tax=unclassified Streptomyces TaxID=2593676 RepID=UPI003D932AFF